MQVYVTSNALLFYLQYLSRCSINTTQVPITPWGTSNSINWLYERACIMPTVFFHIIHRISENVIKVLQTSAIIKSYA